MGKPFTPPVWCWPRALARASAPTATRRICRWPAAAWCPGRWRRSRGSPEHRPHGAGVPPRRTRRSRSETVATELPGRDGRTRRGRRHQARLRVQRAAPSGRRHRIRRGRRGADPRCRPSAGRPRHVRHRAGDRARVRRRDTGIDRPGCGAHRTRRSSRSAADGTLVRVQTPQAFRAAPLLRAYRAADGEGFEGTDTSSCIEKYTDVEVRTFPGDEANLKVTYAHDVRRRGDACSAGAVGRHAMIASTKAASLGNSTTNASGSPSTSVIGVPARSASSSSSKSSERRCGQQLPTVDRR